MLVFKWFTLKIKISIGPIGHAESFDFSCWIQELCILYLAINVKGENINVINGIGLVVCLIGISLHVILKAVYGKHFASFFRSAYQKIHLLFTAKLENFPLIRPLINNKQNTLMLHTPNHTGRTVVLNALCKNTEGHLPVLFKMDIMLGKVLA